MAFLDAYFLDKTLDKHNIKKSLGYYTKIRQPHLKFYNQASKFLTPLFQSDKMMCGLVRDYMFSYSQKLSFSRYMSSQILCGRKINWWSKKEIKY